MSTEKWNLVLKQYPEEMELSKKKRAIWIHLSEGDEIPSHIKMSLSVDRKMASFTYYTDSDGWIREFRSDEKVIRNKHTANKPNMLPINGQSIWNGNVSRFQRNTLKKFLTEYFTPFIVRGLPPILTTGPSHFFHFEFIFYTDLSKRAQDIDNHAYPYIKSFLDTLVLLKVIQEDNPESVRGYYPRYVHIVEENQRRLEVKIHYCKNNERLW